jgi:hypothetical protein
VSDARVLDLTSRSNHDAFRNCHDLPMRSPAQDLLIQQCWRGFLLRGEPKPGVDTHQHASGKWPRHGSLQISLRVTARVGARNSQAGVAGYEHVVGRLGIRWMGEASYPLDRDACEKLTFRPEMVRFPLPPGNHALRLPSATCAKAGEGGGSKGSRKRKLLLDGNLDSTSPMQWSTAHD